MLPKPVVRYMILCDEVTTDGRRRRHVTLHDIVSNIRLLSPASYPWRYRQLCVYLALTEGRGVGSGQVRCVFEETGETVFESRFHPIEFPEDPLEVVGAIFRIRDCPFPWPGLYQVQFWYNGEVVEQRPLRLR